jgi:SET domain-containing protein
MLLVPTYVGPSAIEGVGVFAAEPIAAGTLIWLLEPMLDRLVHKDDVPALPPAMQAFINRYGYASGDDPDFIILELDHGRYMNHSLEPNSRFDTPDGGFALRDIVVGEEITCDYGDFMPGFEAPEDWREQLG